MAASISHSGTLKAKDSNGKRKTSPLGIKSPERYAEVVAKINGQWKREWWWKVARLAIAIAAVIVTILLALR